ncbi:MAG: ATP-binding protein [Eubacterium sp.]|nr:ATP-binding protein [Eubacterium sp.]
MYVFKPIDLEKADFAAFAEKYGFGGDVVLKYVIFSLIRDENIFSLSCEKGLMKKESSLFKLANRDIKEVLDKYEKFKADSIFYEYEPLKPCESDIFDKLSFSNAEDLTEKLSKFYEKRGCGELALYRGFKLDIKGNVVPVGHFDPIELKSLFCYKYQIETLKENTIAFMEGKPSANALLTGARGTGKSSSVKALVNMLWKDGLRLIEVSKDRLHYMPEIMPKLSERGFKFIVFIDDLSFEAEETSYKYLKSVLEGSAEAKPSNVIFYATSNRRHLIAEKWDDRGDMSQKGEIHTQDQLNEKVSLSDRFGLKLSFLRPTPKEYAEIVKGIAAEKGIEATDEFLREANAYELGFGGRSGRAARHFVESKLCGG